MGCVSSVQRARCLTCAEDKLTSGMSAVEEVADLLKEREPLVEGICLGVRLREWGASEGGKHNEQVYHICVSCSNLSIHHWTQ